MSAKTPEAGRSALRLRVDDVAQIAGSYARLGLRVVRNSSAMAVIELPCGIHLVLSGPATSRRMAAA